MPIPNLLHPVPIVINQLNKSATIYDDDLREPIQIVGKKQPVDLPGQVLWAADKDVKYTRGGNKYEADGYILFRYIDLNFKNVVLQPEDQITSIGGMDVDVYIKHLQPIGHYPDIGGATMVKAFFRSNDPAK